MGGYIWPKNANIPISTHTSSGNGVQLGVGVARGLGVGYPKLGVGQIKAGGLEVVTHCGLTIVLILPSLDLRVN